MKWFDRQIDSMTDFVQTIRLVFTGKEANLPTPPVFFLKLEEKLLALELSGNQAVYIENANPDIGDGNVNDVWFNLSSGEIFRKTDVELWTSVGNFVATFTYTGADMRKETYDTDEDGIVDDAAKLGGEEPAFYRNADNHTDGADYVRYSLVEKNKLGEYPAYIEMPKYHPDSPYKPQFWIGTSAQYAALDQLMKDDPNIKFDFIEDL